MNTTKLTRAPQSSERPSFGDETTEILPWFAPVVVLAPISLLSLMLWAPFLLLLALAVAAVAAVGVVAVAVAVLAAPYLLVRHVHGRLAERRKSTPGSVAIPGAIARARNATTGSRVPAFAERTTFGGAQ
jgi:hypothetical protein